MLPAVDDGFPGLPDPNGNPNGNPNPSAPGLISIIWLSIITAPRALLVTALLAPVLVIIATRLFSERLPRSRKVGGNEESRVWLLPYWLPFVGHAFSMLWDPFKLMEGCRHRGDRGIFGLRLGSTTHNIISDPGLAQSALEQDDTGDQLDAVVWNFVEKFFGFPKKSRWKYEAAWAELNVVRQDITRGPQMDSILNSLIRNVEQIIPQMLSFTDAEIDLQPWEKMANPVFISHTESEIDLQTVLGDIVGHVSVPTFFGHALLEKYPRLLHDVYDMDDGMVYFLLGIPAWFPWPGVLKAYIARMRVWGALDDQQKAFDQLADGGDADFSWGDLDDVGEFITKRHDIFKKRGFEVKERGDASVLWTLVVNANHLVFWHINYILTTPGLLSKVRTEVEPYIQVSKPETIGRISGAPKLSISQGDLAKKCPLFRSTYLETLRISGQPWSVRQLSSDLSLSYENSQNPKTYHLNKGEYVTIPRGLHSRDPHYFPSPEMFIPDRFIVTTPDGALSTDESKIWPFGGGLRMSEGSHLAERECLALVAGLLIFWEFEPVDKRAWVVPEMARTSAVSKPKHNTRVRIKRRKFEWDL